MQTNESLNVCFNVGHQSSLNLKILVFMHCVRCELSSEDNSIVLAHKPEEFEST